MSLRTVMQAGPAKANELFARLLDTSDGAMKTREKLFTELKTELELHTSLEEQHLFPILRRNAETKELVAAAIKDNKELRAKLIELETLPKNDEAFPEQLKELQKTFRQHARDEKRELLPAVQRALSEEQVQGVTEKMEAGVANAEQARQDEVEARRLKARQQREQAERHTERQAEAGLAQQAAAEQVRQEEAGKKRATVRQEREKAAHQADQETVAQQAQERTERSTHDGVEVAETNVYSLVKSATTNLQRDRTEIQGVTDTYVGAVKGMVPNVQTVAALPTVAVGAMTELRSAWTEWMYQTMRANAQMSQKLMLQTVERQRRFAADAVQGWMENNAHIIRITIQAGEACLGPFANRSANSGDRGSA
ncbi:MAG: hypothetical protein QOF70_3682 [Acetobacteraceae bacterium]|nr:hypothetical protein [Acetobacteraceae bacterium]